MKILIFILSAFILSVNTASPFASGEQSVKVNPGGTLSVHLSSSDITINVWQKNEVFIRTPGDDDVRISGSNNRIRVEQGASGYVDNVFINIPSVFNIIVNTGAGDLKINGDITGNLEVYNSGGDIDFRNINGRAAIKTGGGNIRGNDINGNIELRSSGGDIYIGTVTGKTLIVSGGGNIRLNKISNVQLIRTSGGNIMMKDAAGNGEISTGGGNIEISRAEGNLNILSSGGDIRVNEISGKMNTKTGGGTIRIKKVNGILLANTNSGEIIANFYRLSGASKLYSGNGNIRIGAAGKLNAKIIARTKDNNWWEDENTASENIISDFKLLSLKRNKKNQEVEEVFEINDGGHLIELRTSYGDIIIRKNWED